MSEVVVSEHLNEAEGSSTAVHTYDHQSNELGKPSHEFLDDDDGAEALAVVREYHKTVSNDNIHIDDALDRVIHMEAQLKILRRRNHQIEKEKRDLEKRLRATGNSLQKSSDQLNMVVDVTGWHEKYQLDRESFCQYKVDLQEMTKQEIKTKNEIKTMSTLCRKKEETILKLREQLEEIKKKQDVLNSWYNKIRVQQRDNAERRTALEVLRRDDEKISQALVEQEERNKSKNGSVMILKKDKAYLTSMCEDLTENVTHQKQLLRAQEKRESQLRARVDILMSCMKDLKLEEDFRSGKKKLEESGALVTAKPKPQQLSDIIPKEDTIPIDSYRLVYLTNKEAEYKNASYNTLLLERGSVLQSMESQLSVAIDRHNGNVEDLNMNRIEKEQNTRQLLEEIQTQHQSSRKKMETLTRENAFLRNELTKKRIREKQLSY